MNCPACHNAMVVLELAEVEIDHCMECGGIWLDAGELEMLFDDADKARRCIQLFRIDSRSAEKPRPCPICDKKMEKVIVGTEQPPLLIDRCRKGDGLWFDSGELQDVLARGQLDPESRIRKILADMFGLANS